MSNIHDIEPLAAPARPGNERSLSELEKATVSHVEHRGTGVDALNDTALMAGERTEKVTWVLRYDIVADTSVDRICHLLVSDRCRVRFLFRL
jgi:hypothetical protein